MAYLIEYYGTAPALTGPRGKQKIGEETHRSKKTLCIAYREWRAEIGVDWIVITTPVGETYQDEEIEHHLCKSGEVQPEKGGIDA